MLDTEVRECASSKVNIQLLDIVPMSLGILYSKERKMDVIIKRFSPTPATATHFYRNNTENITRIRITVYEGESEYVRDNNELGTFLLTGLPPMPVGALKVEVNFKVNTNGLLEVSAFVPQAGVMKKVQIDSLRNRTEEQVKKMVEDAKRHREGENEHEIPLKILKIENNIEHQQQEGYQSTSVQPESERA